MSQIRIEALDKEVGKSLNNSTQNTDSSFPPINSSYNPQGVYDQVNQFFSEQDKQQKVIQEAREIFGEAASNLTDQQVYDLVNEVQYLVDTWIEEYERKVFDGKTLKEMLQLDL